MEVEVKGGDVFCILMTRKCQRETHKEGRGGGLYRNCCVFEVSTEI
jgi:hypothetical protein